MLCAAEMTNSAILAIQLWQKLELWAQLLTSTAVHEHKVTHSFISICNYPRACRGAPNSQVG